MSTRVIVLLVLVLGLAGRAQAQHAKFSAIRDAVPSRFFESATSHPSAANPGELIIGFDSGIDLTNFTSNEFAVNTLAFGNRSASDTISFVVRAPLGYYVSKITYVQRGSASTSRTAVQSGAAQWTVAGFPAALGVFTGDPGLTGVVDLTELQRRSVPVSITLSLFASGTGSLSINGARVIAEVAPIP